MKLREKELVDLEAQGNNMTDWGKLFYKAVDLAVKSGLSKKAVENEMKDWSSKQLLGYIKKKEG